MNKRIAEVLETLSAIDQKDIPSLSEGELIVLMRMTNGLVKCIADECRHRDTMKEAKEARSTH